MKKGREKAVRKTRRGDIIKEETNRRIRETIRGMTLPYEDFLKITGAPGKTTEKYQGL